MKPPSEPPGALLYPLQTGVGALEAVRGSILALDWQWLRARSLMAGYEKALPDRELLEVTPSNWVSFPKACAHWRALDALDLPSSQVDDAGRFVGEHVHGAFLSTLVRLAGQLGASPWIALGQCHKLWLRSWRGGGIAVRKVGPLVASVQVFDSAVVASSRFFRGSFRGAVARGIEPFCERALVVEVDERRTATSFVLRASWV
jgi:hypothetical protein